MFLIGDKGELILLARKPRSKWYHLTCFGTKRHYRKDGSCKHTEEALANIKPEARHRVRIDPWGGKPPAAAA